MKKLYSITLFTSCKDSLVSNPIEHETDKAFLMKVPTGNWTDSSNTNLWIPKSICNILSEVVEEETKDCMVIRKNISLPDWFIKKNKLI